MKNNIKNDTFVNNAIRDAYSSERVPDELLPGNIILPASGRVRMGIRAHIRHIAGTAAVAAAVLCVVITGRVTGMFTGGMLEGGQDDAADIAQNDKVSADAEGFGGGKESDGGKTDDAGESVYLADASIKSASSYDELYELVHSGMDNIIYRDDIIYNVNEEAASSTAYNGSGDLAVPGMDDNMFTDKAPLPDSEAGMAVNEAPASDTGKDGSMESGGNKDDVQSAGASNDYSDTNIQEEGVDEADIIKTDGRYIYTLDSYGNLCITEADDGKMSFRAHLDTAGNKDDTEYYYADEMYVNNNMLAVIANRTRMDKKGVMINETDIAVYDVSNPASPEYIKTFSVDGEYNTSRCVNGWLYVFSNYYPSDIKEYRKRTYVPCVQGKVMQCDDIYIPFPEKDSDGESLGDEDYDMSDCVYPERDGYIVAVSINLSDMTKGGEARKINDQIAVLTGYSTFYVSDSSIYIMCSRDENDGKHYVNKTAITKLNYDCGKITIKCTGEVEGYVDSQFSADEHDGYLRMVTTTNKFNVKTGKEKMYNSLYILDDRLKVTGSITDIARNERIYSARFYGDYAYFVTYRQMDPLFTADVSNPANPVIVSEIKLPGFSDYMQAYGSDRMFGIGYEENENDEGGSHIKLSMFNISDKENVSEECTTHLRDCYYSGACGNHKNLLINHDKNIIGFDVYGTKEYDECYMAYMLYSYSEEEGFKKLCVYDNVKKYFYEMNKDYVDMYSVRGIFIGDYLYISDMSSGILSFHIGDRKLVDKVKYDIR